MSRVLGGRWRPKLVRAAVIAALALASRVDAAPPEAPKPDEAAADGFPEGFSATAWAQWQVGGDRFTHVNPWSELKASWASGTKPTAVVLEGLPPGVRELAGASRARSVESLTAALDGAEAAHLWDVALVGWLWRMSQPMAADPSRAADLAPLYGRLERHARVANALTLAAAETGGVSFRPWMSKAAPPSGYEDLRVSPELGAVARERYAGADAGPWRSQVALKVKVRGSGTLHRGGVSRPLGAEETLARLDLVTAGPEGLTLEHEALGSRVVKPGQTLSAWAGGWDVSPKWVEEALAGDDAAIARLDRTLWATWPAIEAAVAKQPDAKGAPALRLLLVLYRE